MQGHLFAGTFSGVQHVAGDAGKYQQDIPGSRADGQGRWKPKAVNTDECFFPMNATTVKEDRQKDRKTKRQKDRMTDTKRKDLELTAKVSGRFKQ